MIVELCRRSANKRVAAPTGHLWRPGSGIRRWLCV